MSSFEGYHPLLTPNFRFDWLTQFRLKQVSLLTRRDLADTAEWVNGTMRATMGRTALTWGIERRATHKLVGWGGFDQLDLQHGTGQTYLTGATLPANEQQEIVNRLVHFAQEELQLDELTLKESSNLDTAVLTAAGLTKKDDLWHWQRR
ncbi:MAG TPA: GNAT family N-acetyltransferase [Candidatus Levilactobacillus faecigallinarum]|uniref:GNAT family N-acetyltransferase n=1 Tax=Candidatus Levilactobacillus faecigallinarum TaxID=2838638 RepID=A0A9D1QSS4_9LACO|nr:GNAT family N-acetyltransferase [Candidatus Levilactobacillus faecigallinarum]